MRKVLLAAGIILVLLAAGITAFLWRRGTQPSGPSTASATRSAAPNSPQAEEPLPPLPAISLQIDREHEFATYQGTPLIFSVRLANPRAMKCRVGKSGE